MSYNIVRGIKVQEGKVLVDSASNNVYPRDYGYEVSSYFTKILQEKGQDALDVSILEAYEQGNFQGGCNKYTRALKVLRHLPEYEKFNWRRGGLGKEYDEIQKNREAQEFSELLKKALKTRLPADKFILSKSWGDVPVYLFRMGSRTCKWSREKSKAKIFKYLVDAQKTQACFTNSEDWKIEQVK